MVRLHGTPLPPKTCKVFQTDGLGLDFVGPCGLHSQLEAFLRWDDVKCSAFEMRLISEVRGGVRCAALTRDAPVARVLPGDFRLARRRVERRDARRDGRRRPGCNMCGSRGDGR